MLNAKKDPKELWCLVSPNFYRLLYRYGRGGAFQFGWRWYLGNTCEIELIWASTDLRLQNLTHRCILVLIFVLEFQVFDHWKRNVFYYTYLTTNSKPLKRFLTDLNPFQVNFCKGFVETLRNLQKGLEFVSLLWSFF